jgi:hypothetical protein
MFGRGALGVDKFRWNSDNKVRTDLGIVNEGDADKMRLEYAGQGDGVIRRRVSLNSDRKVDDNILDHGLLSPFTAT